MLKKERIIFLIAAFALSGCGSLPFSNGPETEPSNTATSGRYELKNDVAVLEPIDLSSVKPIVPVVERRTLAGNKNPYTVNGQTYSLMESEIGYTETGIASWYGRKFHGHLTSNGEVYDMFELSAAHKTMPIPGYLKVTNLDNGKSVVVRVNDRGPFYSGRIVDLSYAAASMLDYAGKGTARVRVEAIVPGLTENGPAVSGTETTFTEAPLTRVALEPLEKMPVVTRTGELEDVANERQRIEAGVGQEYLQVGAFANLNSAENLVGLLSALTSLPVFIRSENVGGVNSLLHRVRLGPLNETIEIQSLIRRIVDADLGTPFKIRQ